MAKLAKVSTRKTYENWEKNVGTPNINQFLSLCHGCGASAAQFLEQAVKREDIRAPLTLDVNTSKVARL